jgi:hypothetical protein
MADGEGVPLPKKTNDLGRLTYLKSTIDTNRVLPKVANPDDVLAQSRVQKFAADPSWKPLPDLHAPVQKIIQTPIAKQAAIATYCQRGWLLSG